MASNKVRGVVIRNHIIFPFTEDLQALLKARIPFTCIKQEFEPQLTSLLRRAKLKLVLRDWRDIEPQLIERLVEKTGAKHRKNEFLIYDREEKVVQNGIYAIQVALSKFKQSTQFLIDRRNLSKTGKILKTRSDTGDAIYVGKVTYTFDPDQDVIGSAVEPVYEVPLQLGSRRIVFAHMKKLRATRADAVHIRMSSAELDGTEIEVVGSFDHLIDADAKLTIRAFALDLLSRFS